MRKLKQSPQVVGREFMGELLLVPLAGRTANLTSVFAANPVGAFIWKLLDGTREEDALVAALLEEFDVGEAAARQGLREFVAQLESAGAVEVVP